MNKKLLILCIALSTTLFACSKGPDSPKGFSLPKGDVEQGQIAFKRHKCIACHSIEGYEDDSIEKQFETPIRLDVSSAITKTYAQLVTSIINPSHKIATQSLGIEGASNPDLSSNMRVYNDVMTVTELIDIVAFLQPKFKVKPLRYTTYSDYYIH